MFLYSEAVHTFLALIRSCAKEILEKEMHLKFSGTYVDYRNINYPLTFIVYEGAHLGYWDQRFYQIGINKRVMLSAKIDVIKDILRHELAHMIATYQYGDQITPHSPYFKEVCRSYGWGENVYAARSDIENENQKYEGDFASEKLIEKIKKLMALGTSSNSHEAELATLKANELLIKHNLEKLKLIGNEQDEVWVKRVLTSTRNNARFQAISDILRNFLVSPVYNHGKGVVYLEVTGSRTNVELADYIANFLYHELERLFISYQKDHPTMKGMMAKNSFIKGIAEGYIEKIKKNKNQVGQTLGSTKELLILEQNLDRQLKLAYSRLRYTSRSAGIDPMSKNLGKQAGHNLSIHGGISKGASEVIRFLN